MPSIAEQAAEPGRARRTPLTRDRVLQTAVDLADAGGIAALTIRALAEQLGVEAMSLYYHVANKEAILDGVVDLVFREIEQVAGGFEVAETDDSWKASLRARILGARTVMLRHPWAPGVLDTRTGLGLAQARYVDSVVGTLRAGGFTYDLIHHSMHALGSRMFGFSQELGDDGDAGGGDLAQLAEHVPHLANMLAVVAHTDPESTLGWCDDQFEFEFGLDIVLDGLERAQRREAHG
ncbi:TetR/AcrR family transcriptional regulator C-terminal domain-containing protein [Agromyces sp. SYSU K20354]|uniref:TetR/AcrR family transcriptional regulator n=1 Tax=Agromyces cavernae TaxID=2898659 RepID=UPI001E2BADD7|nr:TetR/AcrR family transcriptional regulator C-terminal domain-containing protein [Agromyces cavernae]MCD2442994.1 TetR/AcrR family transcriptional regulator C-terminal domain-containing protein [Agromyces cavernae]